MKFQKGQSVVNINPVDKFSSINGVVIKVDPGGFYEYNVDFGHNQNLWFAECELDYPDFHRYNCTYRSDEDRDIHISHSVNVKEQVYKRLLKYFNEHQVYDAEIICQSDGPIIDAHSVMAEISEIMFKIDYK